MRSIAITCVGAAIVVGTVLASCGTKHPGNGGGDGGTDGSSSGPDACVNLQCQIADCSGSAMPTTLTGTVYAPNGTLPLFGANVYVPNDDPGTLTPGLDGTCDQCNAQLPGNPVGDPAVTDEHGNFTLQNVPVADNLPVVIQIGKWRKILKLQTKPVACTATALPMVDTKLPSSMDETGGDIVSVDMPQIAISTGQADALECLIRKLGVADKEITTPPGVGRVHLFTDSESGTGQGASTFLTGFAGGSGAMADSQKLWGTTAGTDTLSKYDITLLSCEGGQHIESKSQAALDAVKKYADGGGRLFLSHWHNVWIEGDDAKNGTEKPMVWPTIATFNNSADTLPNSSFDTIDETDNPKGHSFATWMMDPKVAGTPPTESVMDEVPIEDSTGKITCTAVDDTKAEDWVNYKTTDMKDFPNAVQNFQFTTPNEADQMSRCGKVVFSDMHVSGDSKSIKGTGYPMSCSTAPLTAQEKALAFMFFDIESCVGPPLQ